MILPPAPPSRTFLRFALLVALVATAALPLVAAVPPLVAQVPQPSASMAELGLLLRQLGDERRVLMVAAHPDDEDTALLAALSRGEGARVAYLSLTRGEGGQNLVGPELDEALGLLRTGELLSARQLDGATQYFSRAYDFGFSRSAEETLRLWGEEEILEDVVRLVRTIRPQVMVSVFHGTPRDGHGHHQAAGILTIEAFEAAADAERFSHLADEGLAPWEVTKLYRLLWNDAPTAERQVETGTLDPLLGRSHFQVAMASRSRHRSQDMGVAEWPGALASRLELVASRGFGTDDPAAPIFQGVATSLLTLAELAGGGMEISRRLQGYDEALARARAVLHPEDPGRVLPPLLLLHDELEGALAEARRSLEASGEGPLSPWNEVVEALTFRQGRLAEALLLASGVQFEVRADRPLLVPGARPGFDVLAWHGGWAEGEVVVREVQLELPEGWRARRRPDPGTPEPDGPRVAPPWALSDPSPPARRAGEGRGVEPGGAAAQALDHAPDPGLGPDPAGPDVGPPEVLVSGDLVRWDFTVEVPLDAEPSVPHFLRLPREEGRYTWPAGDPTRGLAFDPPPVEARIRVRVSGREVDILRTAHHVRVDKALGELREPVHAAPLVSVEIARPWMAWPTGDAAPRELRVTVRNLDRSPVQAQLRLVPSGPPASADAAHPAAGWSIEPSAHALALRAEEETEFVFFLTPPSSPARLAPPPARVTSSPASPRHGPLSQPASAPPAHEGADHGSTEPEAIFEVLAFDARVTLTDRTGLPPQDGSFRLIEHPHIASLPYRSPATLSVHRFPVEVRSGLRVGWVEGPGDGGPEALADLGLPPVLLDEEALRSAGWEGLDVVVLGSRSYETRPDLVAATPRLLAWAERGGVIVSLYHKHEFAELGLAPWRVRMNRPHDRITDPTSPVTFLAPDHPAVTGPNPLSESDFMGWVQERGLYFLAAWEGPFTPLLELRDPGLDPVRGGLLVAPLGAGAYVYTGLALFRQWPRGVPGAFRILANLVSLEPEALQGLPDARLLRPGAMTYSPPGRSGHVPPSPPRDSGPYGHDAASVPPPTR